MTHERDRFVESSRGAERAPGRPERWAHWAELVPDPARSRLRRLAERAAAAG